MVTRSIVVPAARCLFRFARRPPVHSHIPVTSGSEWSREIQTGSHEDPSNTLSNRGEPKDSQRFEKEGKGGKTPKTQEQLDKELQEKMAGLAGDGGEAGVELEGGEAVSMKRSVKANMFRYI